MAKWRICFGSWLMQDSYLTYRLPAAISLAPWSISLPSGWTVKFWIREKVAQCCVLSNTLQITMLYMLQVPGPPKKLVKRGILGISCSSSWPFMHLVFFSNFGSSLNGTVGGYWSYQRFSFGLGPSFAHRPIALRGPSARLPHLSSSCVLGPWGTGSPSARPFARHCLPASWQLASVDQVSVGLGSPIPRAALQTLMSSEDFQSWTGQELDVAGCPGGLWARGGARSLL